MAKTGEFPRSRVYNYSNTYLYVRFLSGSVNNTMNIHRELFYPYPRSKLLLFRPWSRHFCSVVFFFYIYISNNAISHHHYDSWSFCISNKVIIINVCVWTALIFTIILYLTAYTNPSCYSDGGGGLHAPHFKNYEERTMWGHHFPPKYFEKSFLNRFPH